MTDNKIDGYFEYVVPLWKAYGGWIKNQLKK